MEKKKFHPSDNVSLVHAFAEQMKLVKYGDAGILLSYLLLFNVFLKLEMHDLTYLAPTIVILYGLLARLGVIWKISDDTNALYEEVQKPGNRYGEKTQLSEANRNRLYYIRNYFTGEQKITVNKLITEIWMFDSIVRRLEKIARSLSTTEHT